METTRQASPSAAERANIVRWLRFIAPRGGSRIAAGERWVCRDGEWATETEWAQLDETARLAESYDVQKNVERIMSDGARQSRIYDHTPTWDELKREIPNLTVIEHEDGSKSCDFSDTSLDLRHKKRLLEMYGEARELEVEKSDELSSRVETVTVGKGLHKKSVPIQSAEKVDRALSERD